MTPRRSDPAPVLYLTHRVPYPPDKGDRIRNWHLLGRLAAHGPVWLGCLADEPVTGETLATLNRVCDRLAVVTNRGASRWIRAAQSVLFGHSLSEGLFASPRLRAVVRSWSTTTRFRAAVVSASSLVPYLREPVLRATPAFVDLVDVDSQKWFDFARSSRVPKRWLYRLEAYRVRRLEAGLPAWTRAVAVVSRAEAEVYEAFAGRGSATVATNGVDLDFFRPGGQEPKPTSCVFVGAMDYFPNVDGAVWFAREIWPRVRERFPQAEFRIVGRHPAPSVQALATLPGVVVTGAVPDVRPFLASAAVVVAPLRLARGIQNKVLEALAMGKPVVATPPALAALAVLPGREVLAASTPDEFADRVGDLFTNPQRGRALGQAGRRYVETHHHWQRCLEPFLAKILAAD